MSCSTNKFVNIITDEKRSEYGKVVLLSQARNRGATVNEGRDTMASSEVQIESKIRLNGGEDYRSVNETESVTINEALLIILFEQFAICKTFCRLLH